MKFSVEHINNLKISHLGHKRSDASIIKGVKSRKGYRHSEETKDKIGRSHLGIKNSEETRKKISQSNLGKIGHWRNKKRPEMTGKRNYNWKGGTTSKYEKIRKSPEYAQWRYKVYKRDDWTCVWCKRRGGNVHLHADHIKPFAFYPELRLKVRNGRTLCVECHKKTDTYLKNIKK